MIILAATWQNQQNECAPSEDSDQPGHPPSLIRVFAVRMKKAWVLIYPLSAKRRLWSDWADAQADLSLRWAHSHFVGFEMSRLIFTCHNFCCRMQIDERKCSAYDPYGPSSTARDHQGGRNYRDLFQKYHLPSSQSVLRFWSGRQRLRRNGE